MAGSQGTTLNGKYYLNAQSGGTFSCIDLRTGEKLYTAAGTINQGQHMRIDPSNLGGYDIEASKTMIPVLWQFSSGTWKRYDPLTGAVTQTITNVPTDELTIRLGEGSPEFFVGQRRSWNTTIPYRYAGIFLIKWDLTKVVNNNWQTGVVWNVSLRQPDGRAPSDNVRGLDLAAFYRQNVVIAWAFMEDFVAAYDITTGQRLYVKDVGFQLVNSIYRSPTSDELGIFGNEDTVANRFVAFDVKTGNKLWESDPPFDDPWGSQRPLTIRVCDKFYCYSTDGWVRASELVTGKQLWQTHIGYTNETIYGTWPAFNVLSGGPGAKYTAGGADKTLYVSSGISWGVQPYSRFHRLRAYDMDTGDLLWSIAGIFSVNSITDGYLVGTNGMDGKMYTFGKGKTATTVTAPNVGIPKGTPVLIQGTVMDMSPAQSNTPAVAKE